MAFRLSSSSDDDSDASSPKIARKKTKTGPPTWLDDSDDAEDDDSGESSDDAAEEDDDEFPDLCDTEGAVLTLRGFLRGDPKVVWRHHLYSEIANRTTVDRELDQLAVKGRVRLLQLPTAPDDIGVMLADDWRTHVSLDWFLELSLRSSDLYISERELRGEARQLVNAGLLRPRRDQDSGKNFWFACPGFGELAGRVRHGRDLVLKALRSARFHQLRLDRPPNILSSLDDQTSPTYVAGLQFHVRDLLGKGSAVVDRYAHGVKYLRLLPSHSKT